MTRRRALLATMGTGLAGLAGCLGVLGGGETEKTGTQQTLAPATSESAATGSATGTAGATGTDGTDGTSGSGGTTGEPTPTATPPDSVKFNVILNSVTSCGKTCRTIDYTVQNRGTEDAKDVKGRIRVYTPDLDGEQVYDDVQKLGDLNARSQRTATKDIDVGIGGAQSIRSNDGKVTIRVNLSSAGGATAEFTFDRVLDT